MFIGTFSKSTEGTSRRHEGKVWYIVIVLHNFLFTKFPTVSDGFLGEFYRLPFNQIAFKEFVFLGYPSPECAASWYSNFFCHQFHLKRQPLSYHSVLRQPLVLSMIICCTAFEAERLFGLVN